MFDIFGKQKIKELSDQVDQLELGIKSLADRGGLSSEQQSRVRRAIVGLGKDKVYRELFNSNAYAKKIVNIPLNDAMQTGYEIVIDTDNENLESEIKEIFKHKINHVMSNFLRTARIDGYAVLFPVIGRNWATPLRDSEQANSPWFNDICYKYGDIVDTSSFIQNDVTNKNYRKRMSFRFNDNIGKQIEVHPTRVIEMYGEVSNYEQDDYRTQQRHSVLEKSYDTLTEIAEIKRQIMTMCKRANIDVVSIKSLYDKICQGVSGIKDDPTDIPPSQFLAELKKLSNEDFLVLDSENAVQRLAYNFAGLKELPNSWLEMLSAECDIPVSRFLSKRQASMSGNDGNDLENYARTIQTIQEYQMQPVLKFYANMLSLRYNVNIDIQFNRHDEDNETTKLANQKTRAEVVNLATQGYDMESEDLESYLNGETDILKLKDIEYEEPEIEPEETEKGNTE